MEYRNNFDKVFKIKENRRRFQNMTTFSCILILEIYIARHMKGNWIRHYLGDILVIPLIYYFIGVFIKGRAKLKISLVLFFAIMTEILQYYKIIDIFNIENRYLRIIIGNTFDIKDIFCYILGAFLLFIFTLYYKE